MSGSRFSPPVNWPNIVADRRPECQVPNLEVAIPKRRRPPPTGCRRWSSFISVPLPPGRWREAPRYSLAVAAASGLEATAWLAATTSVVRTTEQATDLLENPAAGGTAGRFAAVVDASTARLDGTAAGLGSAAAWLWCTARWLGSAASGLTASTVVTVEKSTHAIKQAATTGRSARIAAVVDNAARGLESTSGLAAPAVATEQTKACLGVATEQHSGA